MALHKAELWQLHRLIQHFDVCANAFALIALAMAVFALEPGIAGLLALFHPPKEVLVGGIQITQR